MFYVFFTTSKGGALEIFHLSGGDALIFKRVGFV